MVLVRSENGQLLMIPQQALAQMQAQAHAQAQPQTAMAPRPATPTSAPPVQISTVQVSGSAGPGGGGGRGWGEGRGQGVWRGPRATGGARGLPPGPRLGPPLLSCDATFLGLSFLLCNVEVPHLAGAALVGLLRDQLGRLGAKDIGTEGALSKCRLFLPGRHGRALQGYVKQYSPLCHRR